MRLATFAALAGMIALPGPALALDKVKFGTNWLADPEAGGYFQAAADGTYEKYGLDVDIIPGGPQSNGGLMLLYGKFDFFMGGDMIGNLLAAEAKLPLIAVAADFQKSPQIFMSHPDVGLDKWADLPSAKPVYVGRRLCPQPTRSPWRCPLRQDDLRQTLLVVSPVDRNCCDAAHFGRRSSPTPLSTNCSV